MEQRVLTELEPKQIFRYFEDLTRIPRESGNEQDVTDYLIRFAQEHGLEYHRDEFLNIVIRKKASAGYEGQPGVILQAHSDMVCEKNSGVAHDFSKDPLPLEVRDGRVAAVGTTLGADNGLGVAIALAILSDSDACHPALEFLCTSDEERGMTGAIHFDFSQLTGAYLINLDGSDLGVLVTGCAGGPGAETVLSRQRKLPEVDWVPMLLVVKGLTGGHSGEDIHRNRASAIKLMGRLLAAVETVTDFRLCRIHGGQKYNAIPREAEALILLPKEHAEGAKIAVEQLILRLKDEYRITEVGLVAWVELGDVVDPNGSSEEYHPFDWDTTQSVVDYLKLSQNGIVRMDPEFEGLVESSVSMGVVKTEYDKITFQSLTRSSIESIYLDLYDNIRRLSRCIGAETSILSNCPEWSYDPESKLRRVCQDIYREMHGTDPQILVLHAGLECGVFYKNAGRPLDMIAMGPDIRDMHAPGESIIISSVQEFWKYFRQVLASLKAS